VVETRFIIFSDIPATGAVRQPIFLRYLYKGYAITKSLQKNMEQDYQADKPLRKL